MVKAETLIRWEKKAVPWVMSYVFLYIIFTSLYKITIGNSDSYNFFIIQSIIILIGLLLGVVIFVFIAVIFPWRYPGEFRKYKRYTQKNLANITKTKRIIIIMVIVLLPIFIFSFFQFGIESGKDLLIFIVVSGGFIIAILGLYFIHLLEK